MQKDPGKRRRTFFEPLTPPTAKIKPKKLPILYRKRRNVSPEKSSDDTEDLDGLDPKTCEVLTKFLTSQGLPLEVIQDTMFQNLFYSLDSSKTIPTPEILKIYMEQMGSPKKYSKALSKATGPLSVTIDVIENENGDNYLAFSIHFFEGFEKRKCLINLKKLLISKIEAEIILTVICRAINILNHNQVKIFNFVVPNQRISRIFKPYNDVIKHQFISFHHSLEKFVKSILKIEVFSEGIQQLRAFIAHIQSRPDLNWKLRKLVFSHFDSFIDLPTLDDQKSWISTAVFLTKCLALNSKFEEFAWKWKVSYITPETFNKLSFLYQVLHQCIKHAKDLSGEHNSISQIIPSIKSMRNYITKNLLRGSPFESDIQKAFYNAFQGLTSGKMSRRYDMATLLDPRFAYDENIYPISRWSAIEKDVIADVVNKSDFQSKREYAMFTREARIQKVLRELADYRRLRIISRLKANESPFQWWNSQKDNLENLVLIAREYLACPAVSIDAQQFFGSGGKFSNLVEIYDSKRLESYLNCAGHHQQFLGHGSNIEHISDLDIAKLNIAIHRTRCRLAAPEKMTFSKFVIASTKTTNGLPEIEPEDVYSIDPIGTEIEPEPLKDVYALVEKEHNYYKSIGASRNRWARGQPTSDLKSSKSPMDTTKENSKEMEPSNDNNESMMPDIEVLNSSNSSEIEENTDPWNPNSEPMSPVLPNTADHGYRQYRVSGVYRRKCHLCLHMKHESSLKNVKIENERLFILLGGVLSNRLKVSIACSKFPSHNYYCLSHFQDSCYVIFAALGVKSSEEILKCDKRKFEDILRLVTFIRELPSSYEQTKMMLATLTGKYYVQSENKPPFIRKSLKPAESITPEPLIIPKEERVPRKQILEKDTKSSAFRIIKMSFKLSDNSDETREEAGNEVTYQIDGDNFWRIEEPENVDAPTSSQRIDNGQVTGETSEDVATLKSAGRPRGRPRKESRLEVPRPLYEKPEALESSEDEGSAHSKYTPDSAPSRPRGRPRKYPKTDEEDSEGSRESEFIPRKKRIYEGPMLDYEKPWPIKPKKRTSEDVKPRIKLEGVDDDSEDEKVCRFCSEGVIKSEAFKGAKNRIRLSEWNKYLGVNFVRNLVYRDDNYVCRKHFRMNSISTPLQLDN